MTHTSKRYRVVSVEQRLRTAISYHRTYELCHTAARKYRRNNPDTEHWVDHYGFDVERQDDGAWLTVANIK